MSAVFMLRWEQLTDWTWYYPDRKSRRRDENGVAVWQPRRQPIRDGEPRLVGELILAGILEGV